eukprot:5831437-Amphidinium_carterae.1
MLTCKMRQRWTNPLHRLDRRVVKVLSILGWTSQLRLLVVPLDDRLHRVQQVRDLLDKWRHVRMRSRASRQASGVDVSGEMNRTCARDIHTLQYGDVLTDGGPLCLWSYSPCVLPFMHVFHVSWEC